MLLALIMLLGMVPVSAAPAAADTYVSNVITPIPMDEPEPEEESDPFADLETEEDFLRERRELKAAKKLEKIARDKEKNRLQAAREKGER